MTTWMSGLDERISMVAPSCFVTNWRRNFEKFYHAGFAASWWQWLLTPLSVIVAMSGWVAYRFRQTRAMTMAQFFEQRYSRKFRIFTGLLAWFSGVLNYGIAPGIVGRGIPVSSSDP